MLDAGSGIVYHYCSLEAFKSIIENKCLWLCDVQKSNDSAERIYFNHIMLQTVENYLTCSNTLAHGSENTYASLRQLRNALNTPQNELSPVYSCSFSRNGDLLSQWRGYADDGYGVAIGICSDYLEKHLTKGCFRKIAYGNALAEEKCKELLDRVIAYYSTINDEEAWSITSSFSLDALFLMEQHNIFYKSEAFQEEQEYRIVTSDNLNTYSVDGNTLGFHSPEIISNKDSSLLLLSEKNFRVSNHRLSGYFELSFEKLKHCFIEHIILGPKCLANVKDIKDFLQCNQYDTTSINIAPSSATYR